MRGLRPADWGKMVERCPAALAAGVKTLRRAVLERATQRGWTPARLPCSGGGTKFDCEYHHALYCKWHRERLEELELPIDLCLAAARELGLAW